MSKEITDLTALAAVPASDDLLIVYDTSAGVVKSITCAYLIPAATTSQAGVLETATNAEAAAGTAGNKILVPSNLATIFGEYIDDTAYSSAWNGSTKAPTQGTLYNALLQTILTTAGDIAYASAANTVARLGITANAKLFGNAAGTAPEWAAGSKIVKTTHDISVTGEQAITGFGFKPGLCFIIAVINSTSTMSFGFDDGTDADCFSDLYLQASNQWTYGNGDSISLTTGNGVRSKAHITTLGSDGVTLTWTKAGSPTGVAQIFIAALR